MTTLRISFSESNLLDSMKGCDLDVAEFDNAVTRAAQAKTLDSGCYLKTDVMVVVDGKEVWGMRFDVSKAHRSAGSHTADHLASSLTYLSKTLASGGPMARYTTPEMVGAVAVALGAVRA